MDVDDDDFETRFQTILAEIDETLMRIRAVSELDPRTYRRGRCMLLFMCTRALIFRAVVRALFDRVRRGIDASSNEHTLVVWMVDRATRALPIHRRTGPAAGGIRLGP